MVSKGPGMLWIKDSIGVLMSISVGTKRYLVERLEVSKGLVGGKNNGIGKINILPANGHSSSHVVIIYEERPSSGKTPAAP